MVYWYACRAYQPSSNLYVAFNFINFAIYMDNPVDLLVFNGGVAVASARVRSYM